MAVDQAADLFVELFQAVRDQGLASSSGGRTSRSRFEM
jgi:hypothetical protein